MIQYYNISTLINRLWSLVGYNTLMHPPYYIFSHYYQYAFFIIVNMHSSCFYITVPVADKWPLSWDIHPSFHSHNGIHKTVIHIILLYIYIYISFTWYTHFIYFIHTHYWLKLCSANILTGILLHPRNPLVLSVQSIYY
jgi:hypothetical protein